MQCPLFDPIIVSTRIDFRLSPPKCVTNCQELFSSVVAFVMGEKNPVIVLLFRCITENVAYLYTNSAATTWISEISVSEKLFNQGPAPVRVSGCGRSRLIYCECAPVEAEDASEGMNTARQTSRFRSILRHKKWD
jgi:hypothetical protein